MEAKFEPATIDVDRDVAVTITFEDGYEARFDVTELRAACPCAACRNFRDKGEFAWPRPGGPELAGIVTAELHGAWGLNVGWNDGHGTGIYPFESLREWAEGGPAVPGDSGI